MSKSKLRCWVSKDRLLVPPIVNTMFFALIVIKSCDLYHTDIRVLEHLNALAQANPPKKPKEYKVEDKKTTNWQISTP